MIRKIVTLSFEIIVKWHLEDEVITRKRTCDQRDEMGRHTMNIQSLGPMLYSSWRPHDIDIGAISMGENIGEHD